MRRTLVILAVALLFSQSSAFAETKEVITEGTYNMGDGETPSVAESRALLQAKRIAIEQAGTYVESYSKTKNFQLTADEIQVLASGVMEVEILETKRRIIGDGINFWVRIKARVSTDKMEEMAKRVKERSIVEDYKKIQEAYDNGQKEIDALKRQLADAKNQKEKERIAALIDEEERLFQANEWIEKGSEIQYDHEQPRWHEINKDPEWIKLTEEQKQTVRDNYLSYVAEKIYKAIENYNKAIALVPNYSKAYKYRGDAYFSKGFRFGELGKSNEEKINFNKAFEDYNKAIALDQNYVEAYSSRGHAYWIIGQYDMAMKDNEKQLALNPDDDFAFFDFNSAFFMYQLVVGEDNKLDIDLYKKVIKINTNWISLHPDSVSAYSHRGAAYKGIGRYDKALSDYNKALSLEPNDARAYIDRGSVYYKLDNYQRAIADYNMAIELNPKNVAAYYNRGRAYMDLGNKKKAMADWKVAAKMGDKDAQDLLRSQGIEW